MKSDNTGPWHEAGCASAWKRYAADADKKWAHFQKTRGRSMLQWQQKELQAAADAVTVFYPFSGPDFLYVYTLFPHASSYLLVGLEPAGLLPDPAGFHQENISSCMHRIEASLDDILQISFFKTNDMAEELGSGCVSGTLPVLLIFLARTENHILGVRFFDFADNGTALYRDAQSSCTGKKGMCRGVEIDFTSPSGSRKKLMYLSVNLSDNGLARCPGCAAFCESLHPPVATFVKSASYLMHKSYFSRIRNLILRQSYMVLQDDSAIPFNYYQSSDWDLTLYGSYTGPIGMFKDHFEKDLEAAYRNGAAPLPFRFGYATRSNLLRAIKRYESSLP